MSAATASLAACLLTSKWMNRFFWNTNFAVPQLRYEFAKTIHSCGTVPYARSMSANTASAPTIACAHVGGSGDFGRRAMHDDHADADEQQKRRPDQASGGVHPREMQAEEMSRGAGSESAPRALDAPRSPPSVDVIATTLDEAWAHC